MEDADVVEQALSSGAVRRKILVVDDDHLAVESLATLLRISGYDVISRNDGASAVTAAELQRPHLIVLDLGMPIMNGYEACREIRKHSWGVDMVIVALSGWGPGSDMPSPVESGFDVHLLKPLKLAEFIQLLTRLLPEPEAEA